MKVLEHLEVAKVEVYKTNVTDQQEAEGIVDLLHQRFPSSEVNFDLQDCDNILRVASSDDVFVDVLETVIAEGYYCETL